MLSLIFSPVLLAFALSLDGFGAGVTYGLRKTRIPLLSVLIISLCSGLVLGISMQAGALLQRFFSPFAASVIGAVILILLGCWSLWQQIKRAGDSESEPPLVLHKEVEERSEASVSGELPATAAGIPAKRSEPRRSEGGLRLRSGSWASSFRFCAARRERIWMTREAYRHGKRCGSASHCHWMRLAQGLARRCLVSLRLGQR